MKRFNLTILLCLLTLPALAKDYTWGDPGALGNATHAASAGNESGGLFLTLAGVIDGGSITLRYQVFNADQGGTEFVPHPDCSGITVLPHICQVQVRGQMELVISGGGGSIAVKAWGTDAIAVAGLGTGGSADFSGLLDDLVLFGQGEQDPELTYDAATDILTVGGVELNPGGLFGQVGNSAAVLNEVSSATNPTVIPNRGGLTGGMGGTGGSVSLITLGVEAVNIATDQVVAHLANGGADPPATCRPFTLYVDTDTSDDTNCTTVADNALCLCIATDTWVEVS